MTDIAIGLDALVPGAKYRGSLTENTRASFDALVWEDQRAKPAWDAVVVEATKALMPTADDVRAEAQRRMMVLVGARDADHLEIIITNGLREASRLLRKEVDGVTLSADEQSRKVVLQQIDAALEAIRAASNTLEVMSPIPDDYADDVRWL